MRLLKLLVVVLAGAVIGNPAAVLASSPAQHGSFPVTGDMFFCDTETYTITSGVVKFSVHEGASNSGNTNFTVTFTPSNVIAENEDGDEFMIRGAVWFGGTFNAQQETQQFTGTVKLQIIEVGSGTQDNVNMTFHLTSVNGNFQAIDLGSCA